MAELDIRKASYYTDDFLVIVIEVLESISSLIVAVGTLKFSIFEVPIFDFDHLVKTEDQVDDNLVIIKTFFTALENGLVHLYI
jgi:hypothetical protein